MLLNEIKKIFNDEDRRIFWTAMSFLLFVLSFETYRLNVSYSDYFIFLFDTQDMVSSLVILFCIAVSFYLFYIFVLFALSASWFYKTVCFIFFTVSVFVEYSYQKALGRFADTFDIQNAISTTSEQQISSLFLYSNFSALIPCLVLLVCLVCIKRKSQKKGYRKFLLIAGLFVIFHLLVSFFGDLFIEKKFPTFALNAFCQTNTDFLISDPSNFAFILPENKPVRRSVTKSTFTENYHPNNNVILVVDESVTGTHLSLNGYERKTTPYLEKLAAQGILHNWGIAASASTGSRSTYNAIVTGITPDDLPDKTQFKVNSFPTIFQYAKAMNYTTYFFDGQMKQYWGGIPDDKNYIDNFIGVNNISDSPIFDTWTIDNKIAERVKGIINKSSGNFIFIFKHGSHIPYQNNFPPHEATWQPYYQTNNKYGIPDESDLGEVVNAYDNSLKYNIDSFFRNLVDDYSNIPNNSIIIYTGDHGQTLFVGGKTSHGGETKIEAAVPLFIIGKFNQKIDTNYKASHQNLYPTLLDLMDYPEDLRERKNVLSLLKAKSIDSKPRFFNPDLGAKVPFD